MRDRIALFSSLILSGGLALEASPASTPGPHPSIKAVWPDAHRGNLYVAIEGTALADASKVTIGKTPATFTFSHGRLLAKVPFYGVSGHVVVTTPEGRAVSAGWVEGPPLGLLDYAN